MGINTGVQPTRIGTTIRDYVDELKLRLHRMKVQSDLNPALLATFINQARRECQSSVTSYMPERFGKRVNLSVDKTSAVFNDSMGIVNRKGLYVPKVLEIPMADGLIDVRCVMVKWKVEDKDYKSEARSYVLKEIHEIGLQSWNQPTPNRPIYSVDKTIRQQSTGSLYPGLYTIYLLRLDKDATTTLFDIADNENIVVEVWYTTTIPDLEWGVSSTTADFETIIPTYLQEYVILQALLKCIKYTNATQHLQMVNGMMKTLLNSVAEMYTQEKKNINSLLPSREAY